MSVQLIGTINIGDTGNPGPGYIIYSRFQCIQSGLCTSIKAYCAINTNCRAALYSDVSTLPNTLLSQSDSVALTATGWGDMPITSYALAVGSYYWLAVNQSVNLALVYSSTGGLSKYEASTYTTFPATATPLSNGVLLYSLQGWGDVPVSQYRSLLGVGI